MARRRDDGFCEVSTIRGQAWTLPRTQFAPLRAAWLKGARFVDTIGFHGEPVTIKTAEWDGIADVSPETARARLEERRADDADDSLAGAA